MAGIPCGIDTKELRIRVGPNNMDMSVAAMNQVADMQVAETNPVVDMVVAETNPVAVGRGARGKQLKLLRQIQLLWEEELLGSKLNLLRRVQLLWEEVLMGSELRHT